MIAVRHRGDPRGRVRGMRAPVHLPASAARRYRWQPRQYDVMKPPGLTCVIRAPQRGQGCPPFLWTAR